MDSSTYLIASVNLFAFFHFFSSSEWTFFSILFSGNEAPTITTESPEIRHVCVRLSCRMEFLINYYNYYACDFMRKSIIQMDIYVFHVFREWGFSS